MTIRHFKFFTTACECKSITKAAEILHVSQPSVSISIKNLEDFYDVLLIDRTSKQFKITAAGQTLYKCAKKILEDFDNINLTLIQQESLSRLSIGAGIAVGKLLLPRIVKGFCIENPSTNIHVNITTSENIESMLYGNLIEIAILENTINTKNLEKIQLSSCPLVAICHRDNPLTLKEDITIEDLSKQKLLLREKFSSTRNSIDNVFNKHGFAAEPIWESESALALINAVKEGLGISILPLQYIYAFNSPEIAILNIDLQIERKINLVYTNSRALSDTARKFIAFIREWFSDTEGQFIF